MMKSLRLPALPLALDHTDEDLRRAVLNRLGLPLDEPVSITVYKRGVDARKKSNIHFVYTLDIALAGKADAAALAKEHGLQPTPSKASKPVLSADQALAIRAQVGFMRPVVVGTGPCGLFAALTLAQLGLAPIVLERGKAVRERTQDTWNFWRKGQLNEASNVQFGEGGAGTFSDGKLWTQVKDPHHLGRRVMEEMVKGGAPEEILYVNKPHIGTFRLVKVVEHLRREIERLGGEIRFSTQLEALHLSPDAAMDTAGGAAPQQLRGLRVRDLHSSDCYDIETSHVILAIGHSARDTFEMLHRQGVFIQAKPFSIGFRIEHPQGLIDRARFGCLDGHPEKVVRYVGAADYKLVHHAKNGRSVYSFCMCPGGTVVAATSEAGRVVTNGMSQYSRNERNANAGIVVGINPSDFDWDANGQPLVPEDQRAHPLAGMVFQRALESHAFALGESSYCAPAQLVGDFLADQASTALGDVVPSYKPGVHLTDLTGTQASAVLPRYAIEALQEALPVFGQQIKGFDRPDAVLTGVETRTSSPIRITRQSEPHACAYQSLNTRGLYPAGEGAGYAGGIMSAAMDGINTAQALAQQLG